MEKFDVVYECGLKNEIDEVLCDDFVLVKYYVGEFLVLDKGECGIFYWFEVLEE